MPKGWPFAELNMMTFRVELDMVMREGGLAALQVPSEQGFAHSGATRTGWAGGWLRPSPRGCVGWFLPRQRRRAGLPL